MSVALIPARGGSKGIRKKNIVDFHGRPLISYTIEQAHASDRIDTVYVSTDDDEIASVSESWDAEIIDRPAELAGDEATTESALLHAAEWLESNATVPDILTLLQCTSPLRREHDIDETVELVADSGYNTALTCCEDHKFYWETNDGTAVPINYDPQQRQRRQDMDRRYQENGSVYVMETETLTETECRLGGQIGIHEMPEALSFEIDTPEDLRIVESIAERVEFYSGTA